VGEPRQLVARRPLCTATACEELAAIIVQRKRSNRLGMVFFAIAYDIQEEPQVRAEQIGDPNDDFFISGTTASRFVLIVGALAIFGCGLGTAQALHTFSALLGKSRNDQS
jgi:hypothetical protein